MDWRWANMGAWRSNRRPGKKSSCVSSHRLIGFVGMGWFRSLRFRVRGTHNSTASKTFSIYIVTYIYVSIYRVVLFYWKSKCTNQTFQGLLHFSTVKDLLHFAFNNFEFFSDVFSVKSWFGDGLVTKSSLTLMTPSTVALRLLSCPWISQART